MAEDLEMTDAASSSAAVVFATTPQLDLLERAEKMVEAEQALTATLEKCEPWLLSSAAASNKRIDPNRPRVRPIPQTMEQVHTILAVARNLASRTSAPAAWNPAAPVMGFSTPNPLPHQLRGGALAALQLERARKAERDRKRRKVDEEATKQRQAEEKSKKEEGNKDQTQQQQQPGHHRGGDHRRSSTTRKDGQAGRRPPPQQQVVASMNLSDTSSSEEESSDDE